MPNFRDQSRGTWTGPGSVEEINAGSLQRIADATEKMAVNHVQLMADRDRYKGYYETEKAIAKGLKNENNALRSVISRLKNERAQATAAISIAAPSPTLVGDLR